MSAPLSPPITYKQALEQAAAQIAELKTPKPTAEQAVIATAAAANTIIAARDRASEHAKQAIHQLWLAVNPYDETAVAAFAAQAARIMMAAQQAAAKAAAVGQAHQLAAVGVKAAAVQSVPLDVRAPAAVIKNGLLVLRQHAVSVDYAEGSAKVSTADMTTQGVFKRPAAVYRYAKSKGATDVQAQALAGQRIDDLIDDNLMLAQRLAQQQVLAAAAEPVNLDGRPKAKTKIIGYRRVIHPELSYGGTCGMCIAASDRIYYVAELLPIHAHCKCTIAAITEDYDPADDLNAVDLNQLYKDAGGTSVAHLKRTRYKVDQHGELGSVMVPKSKYKPRTTKSKVRAGGTALLDDQPAQSEVAKHQLRVMEENLARLRSEGEPEDSSKVKYHNKLIAKLREQAGESAPEPATGGGGGDDGGNRGGGRGTGFGDPGDDERRRGFKGGPTGMVPAKEPRRGGKGYSHDDEERRLEWVMDRAMVQRSNPKRGETSTSLDAVMEHVVRLHEYRAKHGITGRLDERAGSPLSNDEREIVDVLLAEGRNVTALARKQTGDATPDIAVDGTLAEIKASVAGNMAAFAARVGDIPIDQGADHVFVNSKRSKISDEQMNEAMNRLVTDGVLRYIRIIGNQVDEQFGRW
ncbi:hypothetical protein [Mycolicibacterium peregrinum]|uniref:hypothetical protein n=1 Tax=Mycolicibacterium peregrinum TaxID=43304 RepID=UPI003AAFFB34